VSVHQPHSVSKIHDRESLLACASFSNNHYGRLYARKQYLFATRSSIDK
jgi:hypothetical protein